MDNGAIDGGVDGLSHIKNICLHASHLLKPDAFMWLETDTYHSDMIDVWLQQQPDTRLTFLKVYRDFANKYVIKYSSSLFFLTMTMEWITINERSVTRSLF